MNGKNKRDNPLLAAGLVGAIGINVAVCIFLGYWIGNLGADRFGGEMAWKMSGLLVGLAVGILSAILLVKKVLEDSDG